MEFDEENAYKYIKDQLDIGYRIPGSSESNKCANYFISKYNDISKDIHYFIHDFEVHSTHCQNILFKINEHKKNIVIFGAHYDSRAKSTKDADSPDDPVPGANDGASGSAVLIELADVFYKKKEDLSCQIWFVFFDAEDQGRDEGGYGIKEWDWCEGSQEFVSSIDHFYKSAEENFDCMILLDMVGGNNLQFIHEQYSTSSLVDELFQIGRNLGFINEFPIFPLTSPIIDDHLAFKEEMPVADLIINFWNNPHWPYHHTTKDNLYHISKTSLGVTGRTIEQFMYNNYHKESNSLNQGNYPWVIDSNIPNTELLIVIFSSGVIAIFFPLTYYLLREK